MCLWSSWDGLGVESTYGQSRPGQGVLGPIPHTQLCGHCSWLCVSTRPLTYKVKAWDTPNKTWTLYRTFLSFFRIYWPYLVLFSYICSIVLILQFFFNPLTDFLLTWTVELDVSSSFLFTEIQRRFKHLLFENWAWCDNASSSSPNPCCLTSQWTRLAVFQAIFSNDRLWFCILHVSAMLL